MTNPDLVYGKDDPFEENFFLIPYPEELRARAQQVRQDNQDYIQHYVELVVWSLRDQPDLVRVVVALFWLWEDIETTWLAEACDTSVRNICEVAEGESPVTFNCLDCSTELPAISRQHQIDRLRNLKALHKGEIQGTPRLLLCPRCAKRKEEDDKRQQKLDQRRSRAMLRAYRQGSYEGRRASDEWDILKKEIHARDGHSCRVCNRNDLPLHLHHRTYVRYAEESLEDVITLCADCHGLFHEHRRVS